MKKEKPMPPDDKPETGFHATLDMTSALAWLQKLAEHYKLPPGLLSGLKVVGQLSNKAVDVTFRIVDKEIPRDK